MNSKQNKNYINFAKDLFFRKDMYAFALILSLISILASAISPLLFSKLIDKGILASDKNAILELIIITMIITIISCIATYLMNILFGQLRKQFVFDVKQKVVNKLSVLIGTQISKTSNGLLLNVLNNDVEEIGFTMTERVFYIVSDLINALMSLVIMLFINIRLTLISILIQSILMFINNFLTHKIKILNNEMRIISDELLETEEEYTNNLTIIQSDICKYFIDHICEKEDKRQSKIYSINKYESINISVSSFLNFMALASIWLVGGFSVIDGVITYGLLTAYSSYSAKLWSPIIRLIDAFVDIQKLKISIDRVYNILALPEQDGTDDINKYPFVSDVVFKNVCFGYEPKKYILHNNSFVIKSNELNIFIGKSGQGKSTLIYLLTKMWNVSTGEILINGVNITNYKNSVLRGDISYISQNPLLYKDSLRNNLCSGKKIADANIYDALRKVNMFDFVMSLSGGLDFIIDFNGSNLSGGERQRLSVARALLRKSSLYIFDEPTSSLDPYNKDIIYQIINESLAGKTVVLITHDYEILSKYTSANIFLINNSCVTQITAETFIAQGGIS